MRTYLIKDLERLSGVKAHTIRIWEQRYNLLTPTRTDTNIRHYQNDDLRKLLNVSLLLDKGYKISKLGQLAESDLYNEVEKTLNLTSFISEDADTYVKALIVCMVELDEARFERLFSKAIQENGFQSTIIQVIYPFLVRIGIMWGINEVNPAQEHFISNLIRQKIISTINELPTPISDQRFLLFLPADELHEISLLMANYLVRSYGFKSIYLGQDVPTQDIIDVAKQFKPQHMLGIFTTPKSQEELTGIITSIKESQPSGQLIVAGSQAYGLSIPGVLNVQDMNLFNDYLQSIK